MLKEKQNKQDFEYESPDGDIYEITYLKNQFRKYVQIFCPRHAKTCGQILTELKSLTDNELARPYDNSLIMDAEMLYEVADKIRDQTSRPSATSSSSILKLNKPIITDHRNSNPTDIQNQVDIALVNNDEEIKPIESFASDVSTEDEIAARKLQSSKQPAPEKIISRVADFV